jgi:hypothetical protein
MVNCAQIIDNMGIRVIKRFEMEVPCPLQLCKGKATHLKEWRVHV